MRKKWMVFAPLAIVAFLLFIALGGAVVRLLWNWLLPPLFGWPAITLWQALGLLALCRILFGGLGRHSGPSAHFRNRMGEGWGRMTPEEREQFRRRIRQRLGFEPPAGESRTPSGQT
jgi:hypothetical protein